jgi:hypothetical protein
LVPLHWSFKGWYKHRALFRADLTGADKDHPARSGDHMATVIADVPDSLPPSAMKEQFSLGFVLMVASVYCF